MKKLIKLNIENTTNLREIEDSFCEVYSHDRNNGSFEFEITNDTLANETVTALFKFLRTGGYWKTTGTIEDNKIKVKFDTSLITQNEDVVCYLYLDDTERDSDIFSFKFRVKLSELDKSNQLVHKERYINNNVVIDRLNVVTHEDLEKVKSLIPVDVVNAEDLNREIKRIDALETKADNDTVYDDSDLKRRVKTLEDKPEVDIKNLATKKALEDYALKTEIPQPYNDTDVKQRLSTIEQKGQDYATKEQLASIPKTPQRLTLSGNTLILSDGGGSVNLPTQPATNTPAGQVNQYEIHGTGMPNRKVTAPVGTTYVDTAVTNGALKWIKRTGNGNEGWEVLTGDTGWRTLNIQSKLGNSFLKVRRKNDTVMYQFGGLSWGWFGVVRRGGVGYSPQGSDKERNCYILGLSGIPVGFRSEGSLIGNIYNDKGVSYGTWYLGGNGDSHMLRFQFTDPVPTDRDIGDIRVSSISYLTSEPWPGVLP